MAGPECYLPAATFLEAAAADAGEFYATGSFAGAAGTGVLGGYRMLSAAGAGGKSACSFSADTKVLMADGSTRPISEIKVGDKVQVADPETGEKTVRVVTNVWAHGDSLEDLVVDNHRIATTEDHPYWNATDRQWQRADELDPGDLLVTPDGTGVAVAGILAGTARQATAYNLSVDGIHTYYVVAGSSAVLVHNASLGCKIGRDGWPIPTKDNCKACAQAIQKRIGGEIVRITDRFGAPRLGESIHDPHGEWREHYAVIKDGKVYDGFTKEDGGMPLDEYRAQWKDGDYLYFDPVG